MGRGGEGGKGVCKMCGGVCGVNRGQGEGGMCVGGGKGKVCKGQVEDNMEDFSFLVPILPGTTILSVSGG